MDKLARRGGGAIRFNNPSSSSGEFVLLEKSKKERIRKLSAIGGGAAATSEMDCDVSDREEDELELPSTKRFKLLPRKFLGDDCNGVRLGSVPRKLRSAMKKRHRESTPLSSPSSKKLVSDTESLKCDRVKKLCSKQGDRFAKETDSGPITKEEEEVAETLYALAGLVFPDHEAKSLDANASALEELKNSPGRPAVEVKVSSFKATRSPSPSFVEGLTKGSDQIDLMDRPSTQHKLEGSNSGELCIDSDNKVPQIQIKITSFSATKVEQCNEKPLGNAVKFHDRSDFSVDSLRSMQMQQQTSAELGLNIGSQLRQHNKVQESKKKGSGLWPGLSSDVSHGSKNESPILQCPVGTKPPWPDAALSTSIASVQIEPAFAKVTKVVNGRRSCKKCAAHVYISYLIQSLKGCESTNKLTIRPSQMRATKGSNQGGFLAINNTYTDVKSGFSEVVSRSSLNISSTEKVPNEAKSGTFQLRKPHLDQPLSTLASGAYSSPKQIIDFLSMSAGGGNLETNGSGRYGMKPSSQTQVPYPHSPVQNHNLIRFSLPQSRNNSSTCLDSLLGAQQDQLLPSYGNRFSGAQANARAFTKQPLQLQQLQQQQHQQQQQQMYLHMQQQLWAAQYRPAGTVAATAPFPSWQNVRQETSNLTQCGQALLSPSPSSTRELVGPNYAPLSQQQQQQQQQMAVTSFPPGRIKLPTAANALPLQLLCHGHL